MISTVMQKTPVIPFFKEGRVFGFSVIFLMLLITLYYLWTKKRVPIRLLPQVEAMRESVGRCAEMGRPLVYTYGNPTYGMDFWTIAGFNLLRYTAKHCADLGVEVIIPLSATPKSLITHAVAKDIMRNTYIAAGTPEKYDDANFRLTGNNDYTWGLAVTSILHETQPAAHFFLGFCQVFAAMYGEVGKSIPGCVTIGSSFYLQQVSMVAISCDYAFINQDLIAASAYVTEDPSEGGLLRNMDSISLLLILMLVAGSILATIGVDILPWIGV